MQKVLAKLVQTSATGFKVWLYELSTSGDGKYTAGANGDVSDDTLEDSLTSVLTANFVVNDLS